MSYSTKTLPNRPYEFPAPPLYAVWVESRPWDYGTNKLQKRAASPVGQIRHIPDLKKARKRVLDYAINGYYSGDFERFVVDWAIYKWDGTEYVLIYEGHEGQSKSNNPLFEVRPKDLPKDIDVADRPAFEDDLAAALASIASAASS